MKPAGFFETTLLSRIPKTERNALWMLFGTIPENVKYGAEHCRHSGEMSTLINDLFRKYDMEGFVMPYTVEDYRRDYVLEHIHKLPPEERLKGLPPEERLRGLGLSEEDIRKIVGNRPNKGKVQAGESVPRLKTQVRSAKMEPLGGIFA